MGGTFVSAQQFFYLAAFAQGDWAADWSHNFFFGIDAQSAKDGGVDIFDSDRICRFLFLAARVCFTYNSTALNSTAGDGDAESMRPMVAATEWIQFGRATKF